MPPYVFHLFRQHSNTATAFRNMKRRDHEKRKVQFSRLMLTRKLSIVAPPPGNYNIIAPPQPEPTLSFFDRKREE